ncbi:MAG TPA: DUF2164 domain-containing protein [Leucothrix sp.]|nr:DUF2164 domain-containing protein [Leucothrix sp.]
MSEIKFTREEKDQITPKIKMYLHEELDFEIGNFDAEFLLDFFSEEIGAYFYNRGISDAIDTLDARMEELKESLYVLEKPVKLRKSSN